MGRQPAMTKLGAKRIYLVRCRGGNIKHRAIRLDTGSFSWTEVICSFLCQDQDPEHCVQRFQQRAGAYEHHCEGLHCFDRCDPLQGVVREALLLQDRSEGRGDEGRSEQAGGREQVEPCEAAEAAGFPSGAEGSDRSAGFG